MYGDFGILSNSTIILDNHLLELIAMITNAGKKLNKIQKH